MISGRPAVCGPNSAYLTEKRALLENAAAAAVWPGVKSGLSDQLFDKGMSGPAVHISRTDSSAFNFLGSKRRGQTCDKALYCL